MLCIMSYLREQTPLLIEITKEQTSFNARAHTGPQFEKDICRSRFWDEAVCVGAICIGYEFLRTHADQQPVEHVHNAYITFADRTMCTY